jgi:hypothetical protein
MIKSTECRPAADPGRGRGSLNRRAIAASELQRLDVRPQLGDAGSTPQPCQSTLDAPGPTPNAPGSRPKIPEQ